MVRLTLFILITLLTGGGKIYASKASQNAEGIYLKIETSKGPLLFSLDYEEVPLALAYFLNINENVTEKNLKKKKPAKPFFDYIAKNSYIRNSIACTKCTQEDFFLPAVIRSKYQGKFGYLTYKIHKRKKQFQWSIVLEDELPTESMIPYFGRLIEGKEVLKKIASGGTLNGTVLDTTWIKGLEVVRKGKKSADFKNDNNTVAKMLKSYKLQKEAEAMAAKEKLLKEKEVLYQAFIEKWKGKTPGVHSTELGTYYLRLKEGKGNPLNIGDSIYFKIRASSLDGKKYHDLTEMNYYLYVHGNSSEIEGLKDNLKSMRPGEKRRVAVPQNLAYGERGIIRCSHHEHTIPPFENLVFEIETFSSAPN